MKRYSRGAPRRHSRRSIRGGFVLLVVLGMLGALALLAVVFVRMAQVEEQVSRGYLHQARARTVAEAGLERAIAELRARDLGSAWNDPRDAWTYKELYTPLEFPPADYPDLAGLRAFGTPPRRLEDAQYVSFYDPARIKTDAAGVKHGYSGDVGGTFDTAGDTYALKIIDCASQINVNNFDLPAAGPVPAHPGNPGLFRMLDNLGGLVGEPTLGTTLLRNYIQGRRAQGGTGEFSNKLELLAALGGDLARFNRVRDFLACRSWIDPSVVAFTRSNAASRWDLKPRAPVNVNTCSKEVLLACLLGLAAQYDAPDYRTARFTPSAVAALTRPLVDRIADHVIRARYAFGEPPDVGKYPFYDWMHFRFTVLDDMVGKVAGVTKPMCDMIHANANPNTGIRKLNPDLIASDPSPNVARDGITDLDKSDLAVPAWSGTTEWCWSSMGYYEIESLGRIYQDDAVIAEYKLTSVVKLCDIYRATTQKDFETDRYFNPPHYGALATASGQPAVISLPEYPYATTGRYRWRGADLATGIDPAGDTFCATYDGSLLLSGVIKQVAGVNQGRKSFLAGYARGTLEAEQTTYGRSGEPQYWGIPTAVTPSQIGGPGGATGATFNFNQGSDLHPFGSYHNTLKRNKLRTYYGDEVPVPEGTLEFFVKPEVDVGLWGRTVPDVINWRGGDPQGRYLVPPQLDGRMHLVDWGTTGNGAYGRVARNELRLFTTKGRIFGHWRLQPNAGAALDVLLWQDIAWPAHTWHHVEVSWTAAKQVPVPGPIPGGPPATRTVPGEFMLFVDGNLAGTAALPQNISRGGMYGTEGRSSPFTNQDPWLIVGGKNYNSTAGWSMGFGDFLGTIDNFFMHKWRLHDRSFIPKSRYLDGSVGELVQGGIDQAEAVGVYVKRLREVEAVATAQGGVTLGTISCTHVHSWHVHPAGHLQGKGHLSPAIMIVSGGRQEILHSYDACSGLPLTKSGANVRLRPGEEIYYVAGFERRSDLPALTSPILDDFTLSYAAAPQVLYRVPDTAQ
ncbi:MAG: hypothetical protein HZA54_03250 [Planctomycetes bacterium]|nr:hypothetical protein [Planctomycetota bacterium]